MERCIVHYKTDKYFYEAITSLLDPYSPTLFVIEVKYSLEV